MFKFWKRKDENASFRNFNSSFVNELISDEDRAIIQKYNFKNPVTDLPVRAKRWLIDRDRDVFMVGLGGQGLEFSEIAMFYSLVWKNSVVTFETFRKGVGNPDVGVEMWWEVVRIVMPNKLSNDKNEVIGLIKEALDAYGNGIHRNHIKKVHFKAMAEPIYFEEA